MSASAEKLLVLAVDRDGDLESKAGIHSPVSGREAVLKAATQLAISDPEEADSNAIFGAVKQYDKLRKSGVECEVAVVCGSSESEFAADRKMRREVESLLANGRYTGMLLVSDGVEDEQVVPVLQSLRPIVSVVRVVVKHSARVEETYMILGRYLRMLIFDPRYSKWSLGIPGLILLMAAILTALGRALEAVLATLLILGGTFLVRGFNIDRWIASFLSHRPYGYVRMFSFIASTLIVLVGISNGFAYAAFKIPDDLTKVGTNPSLILVYGPTIVGFFLKGSISLIWTSFAVYLIGAILAHLVRGSVKVWRDGVLMVILFLLYLPMDQFATFLSGGQRESSILLVSYILVGLAIIFGVVTTVYRTVRTRSTVLRE